MLAEQLAAFTAKTNFHDLTEEDIAFTKGCIVDWLGSCAAGASERPIQILKEYVDEMGGREHARLITGGSSSVTHAAFLNGASSHIVELDDIHRESIVHAATVVIPAAFAAAEYNNKSGKDLLTAVAIGYETAFRIGEAVSPSHYRKWHNTATCGTFGAAAAAAKLLDLTEDQIVHTLGSAGTQAAGLWEFIETGAMSKQLHPAKAGMDGMISAWTAARGFTGAPSILEGRRGFMQAMSDGGRPEKITEGLGNGLKITENSFKIHASCRHTHQPVDIILQWLEEKRITAENVSSIQVHTYQSAAEIAGNPDPKTIYASKFSIEFCTALALVNGRAGIQDFGEKALWDDQIRRVMQLVEVQVDPEVENAYPAQWGTRVTLTKQDGSKLEKHVAYPKGDPENPVSMQDLDDKFLQMAEFSGLSSDEAQSWLRTVHQLDSTSTFVAPFSINAFA